MMKTVTTTAIAAAILSAAVFEPLRTLAQVTRPTTTSATRPTSQPTSQPTTRPVDIIPVDDVIRIDDAALLVATADRAGLDSRPYVDALFALERQKDWTPKQLKYIERLFAAQLREWSEMQQNRKIDPQFKEVVKKELADRIAAIQHESKALREKRSK